MVTNQILHVNELYQLKEQLRLIEPEDIEGCAAGAIAWYQHEILYPDTRQKSSEEPPNLFSCFEYPNASSEIVLGFFYMSDLRRRTRLQEFEFPMETQEDVRRFFEHLPTETYYNMTHDTGLLLNRYQLFYCYQCDAQTTPSYYNPFVKEVW